MADEVVKGKSVEDASTRARDAGNTEMLANNRVFNARAAVARVLAGASNKAELETDLNEELAALIAVFGFKGKFETIDKEAIVNDIIKLMDRARGMEAGEHIEVGGRARLLEALAKDPKAGEIIKVANKISESKTEMPKIKVAAATLADSMAALVPVPPAPVPAPAPAPALTPAELAAAMVVTARAALAAEGGNTEPNKDKLLAALIAQFRLSTNQGSVAREIMEFIGEQEAGSGATLVERLFEKLSSLASETNPKPISVDTIINFLNRNDEVNINRNAKLNNFLIMLLDRDDVRKMYAENKFPVLFNTLFKDGKNQDIKGILVKSDLWKEAFWQRLIGLQERGAAGDIMVAEALVGTMGKIGIIDENIQKELSDSLSAWRAAIEDNMVASTVVKAVAVDKARVVATRATLDTKVGNEINAKVGDKIDAEVGNIKKAKGNLEEALDRYSAALKSEIEFSAKPENRTWGQFFRSFFTSAKEYQLAALTAAKDALAEKASPNAERNARTALAKAAQAILATSDLKDYHKEARKVYTIAFKDKSPLEGVSEAGNKLGARLHEDGRKNPEIAILSAVFIEAITALDIVRRSTATTHDSPAPGAAPHVPLASGAATTPAGVPPVSGTANTAAGVLVSPPPTGADKQATAFEGDEAMATPPGNTSHAATLTATRSALLTGRGGMTHW